MGGVTEHVSPDPAQTWPSDELLRELEEGVLELARTSERLSDEETAGLIGRVLKIRAKVSFFTLKERRLLRQRLMFSLRGLDILELLLQDDAVTEIMVNGPANIFYEKEGRIRRWDRVFSGEEKLYSVIRQIVSRVNRTVNESSPLVDARLADGSRVHVALPPVALDGAILTIRRFGKEVWTMARLVELGSVTQEAAEELSRFVKAGYNIFISGGTDSGKTTFLNALAEFVPEEERIITIEDSAELRIPNAENIVRLEARNANLEGDLEISIRDLIRAALRMRPDRIIVGEVRDAAALDMLQAMNTGHDGSLSTGHANSPKDMVSRLETMVLMGSELPSAAIRAQIASALDIMIHLERTCEGKRRVVSIMEVEGYEERTDRVCLRTLYGTNEAGTLVRVAGPVHTEKLRKAGYL